MFIGRVYILLMNNCIGGRFRSLANQNISILIQLMYKTWFWMYSKQSYFIGVVFFPGKQVIKMPGVHP